MKINFLVLFALLCASPIFGQKFSKQDVLEDLDYLHESLEQAHYNLYTYTTKSAFDKNFEKVKASVTKDSLSFIEANNIFQSVMSKANNGHTEVPFPGAAYGTYAYAGGTLFPLEIAFENGKALIRKNWSDNTAIEIGSEITSVNGETIDEVLEKIYPLISAERRYFKLAKIELISFPRLYWQLYGEQKSFEVEIIKDGATEKYNLKAVRLIEDFEMKRNEIFYFDREFKFLKNAAYLRPGNFGEDEEKYRKFIDSAFVAINKSESPNLIIDLRNNLGGDNSYSDYLVSYVADKPFYWSTEFTLKTSDILKEHVRKNYDTEDPYWKSVIENESGTIYPYQFEAYQPQSKEKRYTGKIYVLVNRQSHSQSTVTAAQFQDMNLATIVGEETGEFSSMLASQYGFFLPNTGIEVKLSKGYIIRLNGSKKAEGIIPDIIIKDHLLDEDDEILDGLLKRLSTE